MAAISDTHAAEAAVANTEMTVQISTKLNRSHTVTGTEALILPTLGRTEIDVQASGPQFVSVEDTVSAVHASEGKVQPGSARAVVRGGDCQPAGPGHRGQPDQRGLGRF